MATPISFDPANYDSATLEFTPGGVYTYSGGHYKYLQYTDFSTGPHGTGDVLEWKSISTDNLVSADRSLVTSRVPCCVSVKAAVADLHYQFFLVHGRYTTVGDAANGCTAGRRLTSHATTDGDAANVVNAYDVSFGDCIDATSGTTCIVMVRCL